MLGVGWTGERWLTKRCRSGEVLAELATGLEEDREDLGVVVEGGDVERRYAELHGPRIHIRPSLDQNRKDLGVLVDEGGHVERRHAVLGFRIHICPGLDEERDDLRVLVERGGAVERRPAAFVLRIHIRPGPDEDREDLGVLVASGGEVERRAAALALRIHIRPGLDEGGDDLGVLVVPGGVVKGRFEKPVPGIHIRSSLDEGREDLGVLVVPGGVVERGRVAPASRAARAFRIHVEAEVEERLNTLRRCVARLAQGRKRAMWFLEGLTSSDQGGGGDQRSGSNGESVHGVLSSGSESGHQSTSPGRCWIGGCLPQIVTQELPHDFQASPLPSRIVGSPPWPGVVGAPSVAVAGYRPRVSAMLRHLRRMRADS